MIVGVLLILAAIISNVTDTSPSVLILSIDSTVHSFSEHYVLWQQMSYPFLHTDCAESVKHSLSLNSIFFLTVSNSEYIIFASAFLLYHFGYILNLRFHFALF